MEEQNICPASYAKGLDNAIRRTIQNPRRIISPYVKKGMTVLDMGCGPGFFTIPMAEILRGNGRVIAADIQQGMLDIVKKKTETAGLQSTVQLHLCVPSGIQLNAQADFVLAFYVIHEIPDARSLFSRVAFNNETRCHYADQRTGISR